ncbi:MAG: adenylate/guanylate cyclase domain-containing protein, partial [Acidimicrobiia bacterium]
MAELPDGVVTFLFTDVEGSTRLWEEAPDSMMSALRRHDIEVEAAAQAHNGLAVRPRGEGDSRFLVFRNAVEAVAAAADLQCRLAGVDWDTPRPLRVRAALHTGIAELQLGDYYGSAVNRAARLRGIAHGGQTLMSGSTWELVREHPLPRGVTVRELGEHRLKDLTRPERVYQIDVESLEQQFPALTSLSGVPNNLPVQLTDFVGRQTELAEAERLLATTRLLTILAPGGAGKSRLAIQAAADVTDRFPDGVYFVGFADIGPSDDIVQTVAESLGVALSTEENVETQLLAHLANKRRLLVFDNLEHLPGAVLAVRSILQAAPHIAIVATSRSRLNLTGETVLTLGGLDIGWDKPEDAARASGVQLFIAAARRSDPGFVLARDDLDSLARILHLTGGMPLAILLAAAWVNMLPIGEIAAEITRDIDFLETEMGDIPDRQRSMRAVFEYSWDLLSEEERHTFAALSVFRGGFTRDAARAVTGASLKALAGLVSKSLVTADPEAARYEVHELLRQYAAAELEKDPGRKGQVVESHSLFYAELLGNASSLFPGSSQAEFLGSVAADLDNIRSAWRHNLATGDVTNAHKFVLGLFMVYEVRGWYQAAVALFDEALGVLPDDSPDEGTRMLRALVSAAKGYSLAVLSQPDAGLAASADPAETLKRSSDPLDHWLAVQCKAISLAYLGRAEEMAAALDEAIERSESLANEFWKHSLLDWRAFAALLANDLSGAALYAERARIGIPPSGEYWVTVWNLWVSALTATQQGRPDDAIALYAEQVARCREVPYVRGMVVSMEGLGEANLAAGRLGGAVTAFIQGMASAERMGMVADVLNMMSKVAGVRARQGRAEEAVELLATVVAEPASSLMPFTGTESIRSTIEAELAQLRADMDASV